MIRPTKSHYSHTDFSKGLTKEKIRSFGLKKTNYLSTSKLVEMATPGAALSEEGKEKHPPSSGGPRTGRTLSFAGSFVRA